MKSGVTVMDSMTLKPVTVKGDESVAKCAKLMMKKRVGSLLVLKGRMLIGLLTEKDIVGKIVSKNKDPKKLKAKDIMTRKIYSAHPSLDVMDAIEFMKRKEIRRLPIVGNDKQLLGLITMKDILKLQPHLYDYIKEKALVGGYGKAKRRKPRYMEGECESCGDYGRLFNVEGQLLCEDCRDETTTISEHELEAEEA